MRLTNFYAVSIAGFSFRVKKLRSGNWSAKVRMRDDGKWASVVFPTGHPVHCRTKREMLAYLSYAYAGKETA